MEKKYELTEETIDVMDHILHRIRALKKFGNVEKGELGGFIESEENLSQEGNCWVYDNARVYNGGRVYEDAQVEYFATVCGNSRVYGSARVEWDAYVTDWANIHGKSVISHHAVIDGRAEIYGNAEVNRYAKVTDECKIYGDAVITGTAKIVENAIIFGDTHVIGDTIISTDGYISSNADYITIHGFGCEHRTTVFYKTEYNDIFVICGCFSGTIAKFRKTVKETYKRKIYGIKPYGKEYLKIAKIVEQRFKSNR